MKILVVGSTGVLGRHVTARLVERGHAVRVLIRQAQQAFIFEKNSVEPVTGNIFDSESLEQACRGCDAALHLATAIPKSGNQDWSLNDRIRREGTANLLAAAQKNRVQRYIQQSIIYIYGDNGQNIIDESAPLHPPKVVESALDMEQMVRASALDWCILRGGMFYGPLSGQEDSWRKAARENKLSCPGNGSDLISLIRIIDMARAVLLATESEIAGGIYNIVDDQPVSYKTLFEYICRQSAAAPPTAGAEKQLPSIGCSNARAKKELLWQPVYPTYLSGLV